MLILSPDAQFDGAPDIERAVAEEVGAPEATFELLHVRGAASVPEAAWGRCDGLILWHEVEAGADQLDRLTHCRIIARAGVGFDNVDVVAAAARGIPVCNVPDYGTTDVADSAIALLLALRRGVVSYDRALRHDPVGNWSVDLAPVAARLRGGTFGVVGCGRIGTATLRRARAFDLEVGFYDPYLPDGVELALGARRFDTLPELLGWADTVSLHAPATAETRNMIDAAAVAAMRQGAVLINTARGGLVDLDALYDGLKGGRLAAAGLDVTPVEPPAPHRLIEAYTSDAPWLRGRLILAPHAAWYSADGRRDIRAKSARTVLRYLKHGELRNCVNRHELTAHGHVPGEPASVAW